MHYPHSPHRSDYFTCYRRRGLEGHLPLLPVRGLRKLALPALQSRRRPFRVEEPRRLPARSTPPDDAGVDRKPGETQRSLPRGQRRDHVTETDTALNILARSWEKWPKDPQIRISNHEIRNKPKARIPQGPKRRRSRRAPRRVRRGFDLCLRFGELSRLVRAGYRRNTA